MLGLKKANKQDSSKMTRLKIIMILLLGLSACNSEAKNSDQRPNILFVLADDLGWRDVGFNGSIYYETPNLDKLAAHGVIFSNAYSNAPNCAPTRASLLTGRYTTDHGIVSVNTSMKGNTSLMKFAPPETKTELDTEFVTIAEVLQKSGYQTAFFGKWHLGYISPLAYGFDQNIGGFDRGSPRSYFSPYKNPALSDGPDGENLTDRLTDEIIGYIDQRDTSRPFFAMLSYYAVHAPFQAKDHLVEKYRKKTVVDGQNNPVYAAMIETLDTNIGKLATYLKSTGLDKNTIIIFISDNGGSFRATVNTPLKGAKGMLHEGGIRVPCFVYQPNITSQVIDEPVITTDMFATLMDIAGIQQPYQTEGNSIWPLVTGSAAFERKAIYWYEPVYLGGKPEQGYYFRLTPSAAIRKGDYKLVYYFEEESVELYHLATDMSEAQNLSQSKPNIANELLQDLQTWLHSKNAPTRFEKNTVFDSTRFDPNIHVRYQ